ncbi:hypothetical protein D3C81_1821540 [compost metagenome]
MKLPRDSSRRSSSAWIADESEPEAKGTNAVPFQNLYCFVAVLKIRRPVLAVVRVPAAVVSAVASKRSMYT